MSGFRCNSWGESSAGDPGFQLSPDWRLTASSNLNPLPCFQKSVHNGVPKMRVLLIGATGTIGRAVTAALSPSHEIVAASRNKCEYRVDLSDPASIREMYRKVGKVDAVISAAGVAKFGPLQSLTDADFELSLRNKLMGQVNLVRLGFDHVADGGSFTLTSGTLSRRPMVGSGAISLVNAGIEGFVRAAALEAPRRIRVNAVSPGWITETLKALGRDASQGTPAATVARAYVRALEGSGTGEVIDAVGTA
jgi:NAD(P)-dependent dehydrogenase (short-subunit alcohol dehydrogenase family)